jgi:hypothetical protein
VLLLPVANPFGVLVIPEVILVLRFGQPSSLRRALVGFTAVGLLAIALALSVPIIGKKKFLAVQTFASGLRRLHRFQNQEEPVSETARTNAEENPPARKLKPAKKEEDFSADASKKRPAKKIQFLTGDFDPLRFHCWHSRGLLKFTGKPRERFDLTGVLRSALCALSLFLTRYFNHASGVQ